MIKQFLPLARPHITGEEIKEVCDVLKSGHLTTGSKVEGFEKGISEYLGGDVAAIGLNSCTAGLFLALLAHGIGKGDEVIVPTWTFAATGHVVLWTGAKVVLCDVDKKSLNIDTKKIPDLINSKTKAIMPVHFAGYPCNMDEIDKIAKENDLAVIEDAAHAIGTKYKSKKIGSFGDIAVFSFYATKNLACGEGGMAVSHNKKIIQKIKKISYFGIDKKAFKRYERTGSWYYEIEELGYKCNMDDMHAAIGLVQLRKLDKMNQMRRHIAQLYKKNLDKRIRFTEDGNGNYHTYHLFPIKIDKAIIPRGTFITALNKRNIGAGVHFIPLHRHPYYAKLLAKKEFPVADKVYEEVISIPMFPGMDEKDSYYVIENINDILKRR